MAIQFGVSVREYTQNTGILYPRHASKRFGQLDRGSRRLEAVIYYFLFLL